MQTLVTTFLVLLAAHCITDFVFPKDPINRRHVWRGVGEHALTNYGTALLLAALVEQAWAVSAKFQLGLLSLTGIHLLLDRGALLIKRHGVRVFLLDQFVHLGTIFTAACLIAVSPHAEVSKWLGWARGREDKMLAVLIVYTCTIFGGGIVLRYGLKPLSAGRFAEVPDQLPGAGTYIGWLERFLVLTALVLQSPSTVGLILTAKSVVRYPELKSLRFAEYFLIGTLLSVALALVGGAILIKLLTGSVILAK